MVVLASSGQTLIDGTNVSTFGYTPSGVVTAGSTLSNVTLNGQNITSSITTGQIGALLQLRDTTLPAVTAEMNQFTNNLYNLTTSTNLNTTNSGTNATNDANHFFANVNTASGLDNASTIEVNPSLAANAEPALQRHQRRRSDDLLLDRERPHLEHHFRGRGQFPEQHDNDDGELWRPDHRPGGDRREQRDAEQHLPVAAHDADAEAGSSPRPASISTKSSAISRSIRTPMALRRASSRPSRRCTTRS